MADYSGALKQFRESGYPKDSQGDSPAAVRTIKLTDEEVKDLLGYAASDSEVGADPGAEQVCEVTGKLEGNVLRVLSVHAPGSDDPQEGMDVNADAEQLMSKFRQGPMTQSQTIPSPS